MISLDEISEELLRQFVGRAAASERLAGAVAGLG
jgi:hypothetical protein